MRIIRANASSNGIDAARIGVIGFSAGGHLASMMATQPDQTLYAPADATGSLSADRILWADLSSGKRSRRTAEAFRQMVGAKFVFAGPARGGWMRVTRR
jgi:acetyl esterase/lipase